MKYIYRKRTLHSFPDYLKLIKNLYVPTVHTPGSLSLLGGTRSARSYNLQVLGLPTLLDVPLCTWKERF